MMNSSNTDSQPISQPSCSADLLDASETKSASSLNTDAALASRLLSSARIPRTLLQWLGRPTSVGQCRSGSPQPELTSVLAEVIEPLHEDATSWGQKEIRHAASWYACALRWATTEAHQLGLGIVQRMIATGLLPLYRCFAVGDVCEGFEQSRFRLTESLAAVALCHELGDELVDMLQRCVQRNQSPHETLREQLGIDLAAVAALTLQCESGFDATTRRLDANAKLRLQKASSGTSESRRMIAELSPAWAEPSLLWRLSGELLSQRADMVLPREWTETPVPWSQIGQHWASVDRLLTHGEHSHGEDSHGEDARGDAETDEGATHKAESDAMQNDSQSLAADCKVDLAKSPQAATDRSPRSPNASVEAQAERTFESVEPSTDRADAARRSNAKPRLGGGLRAVENATTEETAKANDIITADENVLSEVQRAIAQLTGLTDSARIHSDGISTPIDKAAAEEPAVAKTPSSSSSKTPVDRSTRDDAADSHAVESSQANRESTSAPLVPKILIAEVRSHSDPVFVNILQRQIATCRTEDRCISLASIVVVPENEEDHDQVCGSRENGLTRWQQKLVNWLSDHPQIRNPQAFVTSEGELVLCILDLERGEITPLIRQGLVEVLTGNRFDETEGNSLAKVDMPARFHVGIASNSSPGAGFSADGLVAPALRCLSAARGLGAASIKSIEVF